MCKLAEINKNTGTCYLYITVVAVRTASQITLTVSETNKEVIEKMLVVVAYTLCSGATVPKDKALGDVSIARHVV